MIFIYSKHVILIKCEIQTLFILRTYIFIVQKIAVWFGSTPIVVASGIGLGISGKIYDARQGIVKIR